MLVDPTGPVGDLPAPAGAPHDPLPLPTVVTLLATGWHAGRPSPRLDEILLPTGGEWRLLDQPPIPDADLVAMGPLGAGTDAPPRVTAPIDPGEVLRAAVPSTGLATEAGFRFHDRDGAVLTVLDGPELAAFGEFRSASSPAAAFERHRATGAGALDDAAFLALAGHLHAVGLLVPHTDTGGGAARLAAWEWDKAKVLDQRIDAGVAARRAERTRPPRPAVIPVSSAMRVVQIGTGILSPNLALGLILAYAKVHDGGALTERYDIEPLWVFRRRKVRRILEEHGPSVFLFSNYVWSYAPNLELSALVKEMSPESICIHGGPNTPKYEDDVARFFAAYPHVDVAVRGEGELTTAAVLSALDGRLEGRAGDFGDLAGVEGITYRHGGGVVRTPDRPRLADLDVLPSPYLTGLFDDFAGIAEMAIIETNRGCPYGCTFCDWGSATLARIRHFDTQRVLDEIEWVARNQMHIIALGDANFGMFKRDVEITRHLAAMKERYGFPQGFHASYAKNTAKHLAEIVGILVDAGIMTEGNLALQTNDEEVLSIVSRKNIPADKYVAVGARFRQANLPITTDLILGLPGATLDSFAADLQFCIDHEVQARISRLELLVNSPMNEPAYRARYQIESPVDTVVRSAVERPLVVASSTYSTEDLALMARWRDLFTFAENGGMLKHAVLWAHQATGQPEMATYRQLEATVRSRPQRFPLLAWACSHLIDVGAPPVSWRSFYDEVGRFLTEELGAPAGSELDTVLAVQHALAPQRGRRFPETVALPHDYAAWYRQILAARREAGVGWPALVPPLGHHGPASFTVDDPHGVSETLDGRMVNADASNGLWELESPVSRAQLAPYRHVFDAQNQPALTAAGGTP